jgi:cytochrome P450
MMLSSNPTGFTIDPEWADIQFGAVHPMGIEVPNYHEHFCLGSHLARADMLAALDALLERLPGLRLSEEPRFVGATIRGPDAVRVEFESTHRGR